ncbi:hypothetical protein CHGG_06427 [Chaetomium globosum CBS 148.51]|uniref:Fungal lipase-type domain-containing protein n=1 Tax=Chaetomium globosum (strain ATCC 6205 / CBS 148.51 / DSM 1962 / NBRC 6347 / NRRL 1970) TaxID=306901 RepID=Q2H4I8_CHAGB|nr:uncharacterized protein CHGG_06427 [Chaetomium globosum CBS 148.51]EAQ89808.1 hypothetical protein CHGG_06427 [Chaetomium globosum CBS 148.51]
MNTQPEKRRERLMSMFTRVLGRGIHISRSTRAGKTSAPLLKNSANISDKSRSAPHSAGASRALAEASRFLDSLPKSSAVSIPRQRTLDRYLAIIEEQGIHKIESNEATEFNPTEETWQLISHAAERAQMIYSDMPHSPHNTILSPSGYSKKTVISDDQLPNGDHAITVTVCGSVGFHDWLVNFNGAPEQTMQMDHDQSLEPPRGYHRGFLAVAKGMQENVVRAISEKLDGIADTGRAVDLLFTGHSAGGAIAKLFYAMSSSSSSLFSSVIPRFRHVHCIVFGAPPVATFPISHWQPQSPPFQSGVFLNIVNEGDPTPLSQQEYVHLLLRCFVSTKEPKEPSNETLQVPEPVLRLSGTCIVLRDVSEDIQQKKWRAVEVVPGVLERKLFGDPTMHHVGNYVDRIKAARQAS